MAYATNTFSQFECGCGGSHTESLYCTEITSTQKSSPNVYNHQQSSSSSPISSLAIAIPNTSPRVVSSSRISPMNKTSRDVLTLSPQSSQRVNPQLSNKFSPRNRSKILPTIPQQAPRSFPNLPGSKRSPASSLKVDNSKASMLGSEDIIDSPQSRSIINLSVDSNKDVNNIVDEKSLEDVALELKDRTKIARLRKGVNDTQKHIVINEIANDIDKINEVREYRVIDYCNTYVCAISTILGLIMLLFGLSATVLFSSRRPSSLIIGLSMILFIPLLMWLRAYFFPTSSERIRRSEIMQQSKKEGKMKKKKRYIARGKGDEYRLDDEYVPDEKLKINDEEYMTRRVGEINFFDSVVHKQSIEGEVSIDVRNYSKDNGYANDYYVKNLLYKEYYVNDSPSPVFNPRKMPRQFIIDTNPANMITWGGDLNIPHIDRGITSLASLRPRLSPVSPSLTGRTKQPVSPTLDFEDPISDNAQVRQNKKPNISLRTPTHFRSKLASLISGGSSRALSNSSIERNSVSSSQNIV